MADTVKHTPGPWQIKRKGPLIIKSIGPCKIDGYDGACWLEVSEADALLISASPELLEALKHLCEFIDREGPAAKEWEDISNWCEKGIAAIAKAEGK